MYRETQRKENKIDKNFPLYSSFSWQVRAAKSVQCIIETKQQKFVLHIQNARLWNLEQHIIMITELLPAVRQQLATEFLAWMFSLSFEIA